MSAFFQIEKLDDSNYTSWSVQMKSVLVHTDLWGVVCGREAKLETMSIAEKVAFETTNEKALASILLCVKPSQINHVKHLTCAMTAWNKFREIHQPKGPARKILLFKKILHLNMSEGTSVANHLNDFCAIREGLAEIDVEIPEEMLVIILLSSLPSQFENFVVAMETRDALPSFNALKVKLLEEGARQSASTEKYEKSTEALMHAKACSSGSFQNRKGASVANGISHSGKYSQNGKNFKCFNCGRRGHFASTCKQPKKSECKQESNKAERSCFMMNVKTPNTNESATQTWCVDSGATSHLCWDRGLFKNYVSVCEKIWLAGGQCIDAVGRGDVDVDGTMITLKNVLHVPVLQWNFVSVSKAIENGHSVTFKGGFVEIKNNKNNVLFRASNNNGLFVYKRNGNTCLSVVAAKDAENNAFKWHNRYGHVNFNCLKQMANDQSVFGLHLGKVPNEIVCVTCAKTKLIVKPFDQVSQTRAKELLSVVHSDVCGPIKSTSIGGSRYFATFIDDKSRYMCVYFLKSKDCVFDAFKEYKAMAEKQTGCKIKKLRSDNGREYISNVFDSYLKHNGIVRQLTVPYTPQQNGVAERANRTLVEMARSMLEHAKLGEYFWAEAIKTAAYIRNRTVSKILVSKTPYELWTGTKPSVSHFKVFGSSAVALDKRQSNKFRAKGKEYIMIGYSDNCKGYRLYDEKNKKVIVSRDVVFIEKAQVSEESDTKIVDFDESELEDVILPTNAVQLQHNHDDEIAGTEVMSNEEAVQDIDEVNIAEDSVVTSRGRGRPRLLRTGARGRPRKQYNELNLVHEDLEVIPNSAEEAFNSNHCSEWKAAMEKEYTALVKNDTWTLTDLPHGQKVVGCKWVYTIKRDKLGDIKQFKARLVAKGCSQRYGINYSETFSPVVRYANIRMVIALAVEHNLYLHQMDVSSAYLNSELHDDVYMQQPECFVDTKHPKQVLKLKKSLYGLKQSGREWNAKLDFVLQNMGFRPCPSEPCIYTRNSKSITSLIAVYVDDLIIGSSSKQELIQIKTGISNKFEVVDGGQLTHFLGMEIERDGETGGITLCQKQYILKLLKDYNMEDCRDVATPLDAGFSVHCEKETCQKIDKTAYQSIIGALMYLAISTRPDILHSVSKLSQRNTDPHVEHEAGVKHVLRYLKKTVNWKLNYMKSNKATEGFADADWGSDPSDRKSYSGYAFVLAGGVFSWESKKQSVVALSSTEAEYLALSAAAKEAAYINKLLKEMGFGQSGPTVINNDNLSSQSLVKNPTYHARSKHIDIKFHHIRQMYSNKEIDLSYISTNNMMSDMLTKNLHKSKHVKFSKEMGIF